MPVVYNMLPNEIKDKIQCTVNKYIEKDYTNIGALRRTAIYELTVLANAVYKEDLNFNSFLAKTFNDSHMKLITRSCTNTIPEPGTYLGESVAQFFQHRKQQTNLSVKCNVSMNNKDATQTEEARFTKTLDKKFKMIMSFKNDTNVECVFMCVCCRCV